MLTAGSCVLTLGGFKLHASHPLDLQRDLTTRGRVMDKGSVLVSLTNCPNWERGGGDFFPVLTVSGKIGWIGNVQESLRRIEECES